MFASQGFDLWTPPPFSRRPPGSAGRPGGTSGPLVRRHGQGLRADDLRQAPRPTPPPVGNITSVCYYFFSLVLV